MVQNVSDFLLIFQSFKKAKQYDSDKAYKKTSFGPEEGKTEQLMMLRKKHDQIS